jgi:hypothetical protein
VRHNQLRVNGGENLSTENCVGIDVGLTLRSRLDYANAVGFRLVEAQAFSIVI